MLLRVPVFVPLIYRYSWKNSWGVAKETVWKVGPAAPALFFALGMVFIMMESGGDPSPPQAGPFRPPHRLPVPGGDRENPQPRPSKHCFLY